jgi:hypothetical protein
MPSMKGGFQISNTFENTQTSPFLTILKYVAGLIVFFVFLLTVINYTIYPIWKLRPGDKGLIPLPGSDDSVTVWTSKPYTTIPILKSPIGTTCTNWSGMLDIQIDNTFGVTSYSGIPRPLFWRGDSITYPSGSVTNNPLITSLIPNFNICIYLDKDINNLYVATLLNDSTSNTPVLIQSPINNIPTRKPLRIGWMLGEKVLEVYLNGYLVKSTLLPSSVLTLATPSFSNDVTTFSNVFQIQSLKLWNRPLSASEFRALGQPSSFTSTKLGDTAQCSS